MSSARVAGSSRSPKTSRIATPVSARNSRAVCARGSASRPLRTTAPPGFCQRPRAGPDPTPCSTRRQLLCGRRSPNPCCPHPRHVRRPQLYRFVRVASSKRHENLCKGSLVGSPPREEAALSRIYETHRYRTLFLSDLHLGTRGCQAHLILDMLRHIEADTIYLVGDIIDGWRLRSGWYWPQRHNDVMQKLLRMVRQGARMVFVPGNHDEFARQFFGPELRRHRDQAPGDPHGGRRQALSRHPRRRIRCCRAPFEVARLFRRLGLRVRPLRQHPLQRRPPGRSAYPIGRSRPGRSSRSRTRSASSVRSSGNWRAKPGDAGSTA